MTNVVLKLDNSDLKRGVDLLRRKALNPVQMLIDMEIIAEAVLNRAVGSPVPRDTGDLANSGRTFPQLQKKSVVFGFNKIYAAFQDAPNRTAPYVLKPKTKKWLYVPLTRAGRRHRLGADPKSEGLIFGGFLESIGRRQRTIGLGGNADYVLAKKVVIPIKSYGSALGPNHYFSVTVRRSTNFVLRAMAKNVEDRLSDTFPALGG